jgi:endonuclease/exonuclease/phosphatase family metal-dependent hydrolase
VLAVPQWGEVHAICVHLGLREQQRRRQLDLLNALVLREIPAAAPLIVAGDFNDWRGRADALLRHGADLHSAFERAGVAQPRTFPARLPLLPLDRIYVRNLSVQSACVLSALPWPHLSDHLPLLAEVTP